MSQLETTRAMLRQISPMQVEAPFPPCSFNNRPVYVPNACNYCLSVQEVKICSKCKLTAYCCVDHQRLDWPNHKNLCKFLSQTRQFRNRDPTKEIPRAHYYTEQELFYYKLLRTHTTACSPFVLRDYIMFNRHCAVCCRTDRETLRPCGLCFMVDYCCREHQEQHYPEHSLICPRFSFALRCLQASKNYSLPPVWLSPLQHKEYSKLPEDWIAYLAMRGLPLIPAPEIAMITEVLSMPLTILLALERLKSQEEISQMKKLVIHVVWSSDWDTVALNRYEEILHLLPNLQELVVVIMGDELSETQLLAPSDITCDNCLAKNRTFHITVWRHDYIGFWHAWKDEYSGGKIPDIAVMFNVKMYSRGPRPVDYPFPFQYDDVMFEPVIDHFIEHNVPVLMTGRNKFLMDQMLRELKYCHDAHVAFDIEHNPLASLQPKRVWQPLDANGELLDYSNQYMMAIQGREPDGKPFFMRTNVNEESREYTETLMPGRWPLKYTRLGEHLGEDDDVLRIPAGLLPSLSDGESSGDDDDDDDSQEYIPPKHREPSYVDPEQIGLNEYHFSENGVSDFVESLDYEFLTSLMENVDISAEVSSETAVHELRERMLRHLLTISSFHGEGGNDDDDEEEDVIIEEAGDEDI